MTNQPDFDIRTLDLASYFAPFGRRTMPDRAIWLLSLASSCLPENSVGAEVWIARVSGACIHDGMLKEWATGLADAFGTGEVKVNRGERRRCIAGAYSSTWGHVAAWDGMVMVLEGRRIPAHARAEALGCDRRGYKKVRDLVAGFALMQAEQYEDALRWAVRACRMGDIDLNEPLISTAPASA